jgi:hypothetical protein
MGTIVTRAAIRENTMVCESRSGAQSGAPGQTRLRRWAGSLIVGILVVVVYQANRRELGTSDTLGTSLLPLTIMRGHGIFLDSQWLSLQSWTNNSMTLVVRWHGHLVSRYPIAPALVILPLCAPQIAVADRYFPGWDRIPELATGESRWTCKRSLVVLLALAAVMLHRHLIRVGLVRTSVPAVLAAFLGSDIWTAGSQACWQHGPAAFALVSLIVLLYPMPVSRWRLIFAGVAAACLIACRLSDALLVGAIVLFLARTQPRGLAYFLPAPILGALALLVYNLVFFGAVTGGLAELEALHPRVHNVSGTWSGDLIQGALGTLISPNRGLLVFSPWIGLALAVAAVPAVARRIAADRLLSWLLASLLPYLLIYSKYSVWWGGHCFGPRYWTDVIPIFAILLAIALDWIIDRSRILTVIGALAIIWSIALQAIGAFCYPSDWNLAPRNVDQHHERLWDWRDTEISRCLMQSFPRASGRE